MKPPLVLIPGNMCDARLWTGEPSLVARLAARGHHVAHADTLRDRTISGIATRALAELDQPCVAVGFSMGAIVALEMARQMPDRIAALVLLGLNAGPDLPERAARRPDHQARVLEGGLDRLVTEELKPLYFSAGSVTDRLLYDRVLAMARALGPAVFVNQSEALRTRADLCPTLETLACPVLLGVGEQDRLCPPEWHLNWHSRIPAARLVVFERAGHMLPLEAPTSLGATICSWLDEVGL